MSCIFDAPQSLKLALLMHFMYIKRVSGEYLLTTFYRGHAEWCASDAWRFEFGAG